MLLGVVRFKERDAGCGFRLARFVKVVSLDSAHGWRQGDCGLLSAQGRRLGELLWLLKMSSSSSTFKPSVSATVGITGLLAMVAGTTRGEQIIGSPTWPRSEGPRIGDP